MPRPDITTVATKESRRKGALRAAEVKRERSKSFRQRLADKLDEQADEIIKRLLDASEEDWRAITAALDQAYGKPKEQVELTGRDGGPIETADRSASLTDVAAVLRSAGALPADSG